MAAYAHHRQASGQRRASSFQKIVKNTLQIDQYPNAQAEIIPALHDLQYIQAILANTYNFSAVSKCEVLEIAGGFGTWHQVTDDASCARKVQEWSEHNSPHTLIWFLALEDAAETTFGRRLSLSGSVAKGLLERFHVSPQFIPLMLGEPDYWGPSDFTTFDRKGEVETTHFACQQPRWNIHRTDMPWSVCMTYMVKTQQTRYLVVSGVEAVGNEVLKRRLSGLFARPSPTVSSSASPHVLDPFLVHAMVTHEAFTDAKTATTESRYKLYDQLDLVDTYSHNPADRDKLEEVTIALHTVSQQTDVLLASADMASMITEKLMLAHQRYRNLMVDPRLRKGMAETEGALSYLQSSVESQKRWLNSYRARKDIAMNLVYNLVIQQDSYVNTTIAQDTNSDSRSMKVIAALTMTFLPGTFLASIFGDHFASDAKWWLYIAVAIPLTATILLIWWQWELVERLAKKHLGWDLRPQSGELQLRPRRGDAASPASSVSGGQTV